MSIKVGQNAPEFTLQGVVGDKFKDVCLDEFKGKWVVLFFYPLDFTFICPTEITEFSNEIVSLSSSMRRCWGRALTVFIPTRHG